MVGDVDQSSIYPSVLILCVITCTRRKSCSYLARTAWKYLSDRRSSRCLSKLRRETCIVKSKGTPYWSPASGVFSGAEPRQDRVAKGVWVGKASSQMLVHTIAIPRPHISPGKLSPLSDASPLSRPLPSLPITISSPLSGSGEIASAVARFVFLVEGASLCSVQRACFASRYRMRSSRNHFALQGASGESGNAEGKISIASDLASRLSRKNRAGIDHGPNLGITSSSSFQHLHAIRLGAKVRVELHSKQHTFRGLIRLCLT